MLTPKMSQALADAIECDLDPWAYGSGVIAALKRRGFIVRNDAGLVTRPTRYHATEAGAEAWREWCRASMVSARNAAEA